MKRVPAYLLSFVDTDHDTFFGVPSLQVASAVSNLKHILRGMNQARGSVHVGGGCINVRIWVAALLLWCPVLSYAEVSSDHGGPNGGSIRPGNDTDACSATNAGAIRYNANNLWVCNGTTWSQLSSAAGAGAAAGVSGSIQFNSGGALAGRGDLTVDGNGRVGIGTTPSSLYALNVAGTGSSSGLAVGANSANPAFLEIGEGATGNHYAFLDLTGDPTYTDYGFRLVRENTGANANSSIMHRGTGNLSLWTQEAAPIRFLTSGTEAMRILPNGNVGIGTTNPTSALTVASGDAQYPRAITVLPSTHATSRRVAVALDDWMLLQDIIGTGVKDFSIYQPSAAAHRLFINTAGNVGIGTTAPEAALHVSGTILLNNSRFLQVKDDLGVARNVVGTLSDGTVSVNGYRGSQMILGVNGVTYLYGSGGASVATMSVMQNGRVGIGYNIASSTLHVNGEVQPGTSGAACAAANNGAIRYVAGDLQYCVGTTWREFASSTGATAAAAGVSGSIQFNSGGALAGRSDFTLSPGNPGVMYLGANGSTDAAINVGENATGNHYAYLDLVGDATYTDYGLRLIRGNAGANTTSDIIHRGTGSFSLWTQDNAPIRFMTSSTEAMRILPGGNVGIGTTTANESLTVARNTAGTNINGAAISINNGGTGDSVLTWLTPGTRWYAGMDQSDQNGGAKWKLAMTGAAPNFDTDTKLTVQSDGRVGIGTTSPAYTLDVNGNIGTRGAANGVYVTDRSNSSLSTFYRQGNFTRIYDSDSSGDRMVINNTNGNVGIGSTNPGAKLSVTGLTVTESAASTYYQSAQFVSPLAGGSQRLLEVGGNQYNNYLQSYDYGSTFGHILLNPRGGNVGIGTANPGYKLHVAGDILAEGGFLLSSGDTGWYNSTYAGGVYMADATWVRTYNQKGFWTGAGILSSQGGLSVGYGGALPPTTGAIIAGNVGIGISNPAAKLEVNSNSSVATPNLRLRDGSFSRLGYNVNGTDVWTTGADASTYFIYNTATGQNRVGVTSVGDLWVYAGAAYKPGGGSWAATSDRRLKKNIQPLSGGLARVMALNPVSFEWVNPAEHASKTHVTGFVAQDVEKVFPDYVGTQDAKGKDKSLVGPDGKNKTIDLPIGFDAQLVSAIKELKADNDNLRQQLDELRREIRATRH